MYMYIYGCLQYMYTTTLFTGHAKCKYIVYVCLHFVKYMYMYIYMYICFELLFLSCEIFVRLLAVIFHIKNFLWVCLS